MLRARKSKTIGAVLVVCVGTVSALPGGNAHAQGDTLAPNLRTPAPVIHLAENLDEKDGLGWCLDTLGRGFSTSLQVHSCKPQGGDVQFSFEPETGAIRSVAFPDHCAVRQEAGPTNLGLAPCDADDPDQRFAFDADTGALSAADAPDQCLSAGEASRSAGPFMSRELLLTDCTATDPALRRWVIRH
ncbi:ricin-type beta-trefoil lectin domain protein [Tropicimonas aquimaris]|uniref:Ricin-type beta-trefoil lectin domain protein n=1 Tax=Tropicimonas aquimaris TaxID=914152 RepID=A0ABW3IPN3_9RHOB